jgi:hypothetical protein
MKFLIFPILMISSIALAQAPHPELSTSDKVAITAIEQKKQDAQKQFSDAQQQEVAILREWSEAHKGWHVNPQTFVVEADTKSEPANPAPKK